MDLLYKNRSQEDQEFIKYVCNDILSNPYEDKSPSTLFAGVFIDGRNREINCLEDYACFHSFSIFSEYSYPIYVFVHNVNNFLDNNQELIKKYNIQLFKIKELRSLEEYSSFCIRQLYNFLPQSIENIITLQSGLQGGSLNITKATRIKCYDMRDNMIIVEVIEVIKVIKVNEMFNTFSIKIKNIKYYNDKIFVYGTEVNDFHALNKEYINTLNVCAVQELHRKIITQQEEITELNEKINVLINYVDLSKIMTLQDEINELRSRFDVLLNYIDLSK
jgi:hypothetical protein